MDLDLTPLAAALEQRSGGSVDLEPPSPVPVPPPVDADALHLGLGEPAHAVLRLGADAVATLSAILAGSAEARADADAVLTFVQESLPQLGPIRRVAETPESVEISRVGLHVEPPGESLNLFLFELAPEAAEPRDDRGDGDAADAATGRLTVVLVDVQPDREAELRALLQADRWRILDASSPRAVLDWALLERVVDVIILDGRWPHAARLKQNLDADERTRDLPVLPPDGHPAEVVAAARREALAKRLADSIRPLRPRERSGETARGRVGVRGRRRA